MVDKHEVKITRRMALKGTALAALGSVAMPLQSFTDAVKPQEAAVCPVCQSAHGKGRCHAK
jgi:hypothetical protein